jgi:hypothetical protein
VLESLRARAAGESVLLEHPSPRTPGVGPLEIVALQDQRLGVETSEDGVPATTQSTLVDGTVESDEDSDSSPAVPEVETAEGEDAEMTEASVVDSEDVEAGVVYRRRRTKVVYTGPARKSARNTGLEASVPVLQRAQERTAARNLEPTGTDESNFRLLHKYSDAHLLKVTHDSGMAFHCASRPETEVLSLIRAKEAAQASLAQAAYRKECEAAKAAKESTPLAPEVTTDQGEEECANALVDVPILTAPHANTRGKSKVMLAARRGRRKGARA